MFSVMVVGNPPLIDASVVEDVATIELVHWFYNVFQYLSAYAANNTVFVRLAYSPAFALHLGQHAMSG